MSGTIRYRVDKTHQHNGSNALTSEVFFWHWINFLNDHSGITWLGYGTGKSQSGTTVPSSWLNWDPTTTATAPFDNNSWVVWEMTNASELLDGSGSFPWQAKIQVCSDAVFDDCNVADTDYDSEGRYHVVCLRTSPMGGWDEVTLDFSPVTGEAVSNNYQLFDADVDSSNNTNGSDNQYPLWLDILADDDVIWWQGYCSDDLTPGVVTTGGYLGMIVRRNADISYPFLLLCGEISDRVLYGDNKNNDNQWILRSSDDSRDGDSYWPSFSLWQDGTAVTKNRTGVPHVDVRVNASPDAQTGEDVLFSILVEYVSGNNTALFGELLHYYSTAKDYSRHQVITGNSTYHLQIVYNVASLGDTVITWYGATTPSW